MNVFDFFQAAISEEHKAKLRELKLACITETGVNAGECNY